MFLEDFEDSSKFEPDQDSSIKIGSFRLSLSKKKDIYKRKYSNWLKMISDFGGYLSAIKLIASLLVLAFVNPNDNLRIYNSFINNADDKFKDTSRDYINDFVEINKKINLANNLMEINNENKNDELLPENLTEIKIKDKCLYIWCRLFTKCCCKKPKLQRNIAISNYLEEKLTIESYFENHLIKENEKKNETIEEIKNTDEYKNIEEEEERKKYLHDCFIKNKVEIFEKKKQKNKDEKAK